MPWIESHTELPSHPKFLSLQATMGWDTDTTIGKLHRFWWWCLTYALDGQLAKFSAGQLGAAVGLAGKEAERFVAAMIDAQFLDRSPFRVHDWWAYIGRYAITKYKDEDKAHLWRRIKEFYDNPADNGSTNHTNNSCNNSCNNPSEQPLLGAEPNLPTVPTIPTVPTNIPPPSTAAPTAETPVERTPLATTATPAPAPTPKTRPEKKPNGAHAEFIAHFVACWERRYPGVKYPFTPADASAAKRILAAVGPAGDWRGIVERYCRSPDTFIAEKMRHSLRYLQQCLPKFAVDPNAPKPFIEDN